MNALVDEFMAKTVQWRDEFEVLRALLLECPVKEELKWGQPCYTYDGNNVVLIHGFKEYCAILFIKGSLLKDPRGVLITQTKNVQAGRQIRFTGVQEIVDLKSVIQEYVQEAIEVEKQGLKVPFKEAKDFSIPEELQNEFNNHEAFKTAFFALTPGRQKAYLLHFSEPKQSKTRTARIEKYFDRILEGLGLND